MPDIDSYNISLLKVPIGFIYMQLPYTQEPMTLWPSSQWRDISEEYAGLFFRVLGNGSERFDSVQSEGYKKLETFKIEGNIEKYLMIPYFVNDIRYGHEYNYIIPPIIPKHKFNIWYPDQHDKGSIKYFEDYHYYYFNIKFNDNEVRPKNTAIKVWQRIA